MTATEAMFLRVLDMPFHCPPEFVMMILVLAWFENFDQLADLASVIWDLSTDCC